MSSLTPILKEYIKQIYFSVLIEGRLDDIKNKYRNKVDEKYIDYLSQNDPSKNNKYLEWMVKILIQEQADPENIIKTVTLFHDNIKKIKNKDINSYKTLEDLYKITEEASKAITKTQKRKIAKGGADTIYEDDQYIIIHPKTQDAVCQYGKGSKWCITQRKEGHYESYLEKNIIFYYVLNKERKQEDPYNKVAFAIYRDENEKFMNYQAFDALDHELGQNELKSAFGNMANKFISMIKADAEQKPKNPEVALAGFEKDLSKIKNIIESINEGPSWLELEISERKIINEEPHYTIDVKIIFWRVSEELIKIFNSLSPKEILEIFNRENVLLPNSIVKRLSWNKEKERLYLDIYNKNLQEQNKDVIMNELLNMTNSGPYGDNLIYHAEAAFAKSGILKNYLGIDSLKDLNLNNLIVYHDLGKEPYQEPKIKFGIKLSENVTNKIKQNEKKMRDLKLEKLIPIVKRNMILEAAKKIDYKSLSRLVRGSDLIDDKFLIRDYSRHQAEEYGNKFLSIVKQEANLFSQNEDVINKAFEEVD